MDADRLLAGGGTVFLADAPIEVPRNEVRLAWIYGVVLSRRSTSELGSDKEWGSPAQPRGFPHRGDHYLHNTSVTGEQKQTIQ